jgi:hypothetical protein
LNLSRKVRSWYSSDGLSLDRKARLPYSFDNAQDFPYRDFFAPTTVLAGSTLLHSTLASPLADGDIFALSARDVFVDSTTNCRDNVYGATSLASGTTCIGITEGTLTASVAEAWVLDDVHIYIGTTQPTVAQPGQLPYGTHKVSCTKAGLTATCAIPMKPEWRICDKSLFVAIHVAATTPTGVQETGWGKGPCYDTKGNCAKYWTFSTACSYPVVYDFEPITTTVSTCQDIKLWIANTS